MALVETDDPMTAFPDISSVGRALVSLGVILYVSTTWLWPVAQIEEVYMCQPGDLVGSCFACCWAARRYRFFHMPRAAASGFGFFANHECLCSSQTLKDLYVVA